MLRKMHDPWTFVARRGECFRFARFASDAGSITVINRALDPGGHITESEHRLPFREPAPSLPDEMREFPIRGIQPSQDLESGLACWDFHSTCSVSGQSTPTHYHCPFQPAVLSPSRSIQQTNGLSPAFIFACSRLLFATAGNCLLFFS
jgi:hypothetical protein